MLCIIYTCCHILNRNRTCHKAKYTISIFHVLSPHFQSFTHNLGGERKYASWQKYLWFSFLKHILSMQVPLWRKTGISSCTEFMDKKLHAHLWESHCKDLFLYEIIMREPLQRFLFIWNNLFLGFWSLQNFLWSYQWMDAGKRKSLSPET